MRDDIGRLLLRLTVGSLLLFHGVSKLRHGVAWIAKPLAAHHLPAFLAYGVYAGEVLGPILLILGVLTRPAALLVVIDIVMALFLVVQGRAFGLDPQTGALAAELQLLYIFGALAIAFLGSGRFAISKGRGRWN